MSKAQFNATAYISGTVVFSGEYMFNTLTGGVHNYIVQTTDDEKKSNIMCKEYFFIESVPELIGKGNHVLIQGVLREDRYKSKATGEWVSKGLYVDIQGGITDLGKEN